MNVLANFTEEELEICTANEIQLFQNTMPSKLIQKGPSSSTPIPVVLVTNLNPNVSLDHLFILFGVYGDVIRIKMFEKKLCYIEFLETEHSERAIKYLDNCELWGKHIKVSAWIYDMPDSSPDRKCDYREYIDSPLHRHKYRKPGLPNYIYAPSSTLHLSNMPSKMEEDDLKYLFGSYGRIKSIRFFPRSIEALKSKAIIEMSTLHEGIMALINYHGKELSRNMHLRCNFYERNY